MATTKLVLGISLALLVAVGAGWVWGTSGRSDSDRALQIAELRAELLEGRAAVLDARLDIYSVNFGEASRHVEAARTSLRAANARLLSLSLTEDAKSLEAALTLIDEAQRLAGQLNQDANAVAGDAAKTIGDVLGRVAKRRRASSSARIERAITCGRRTVHNEIDDCNDDGGSTGDYATAGGRRRTGKATERCGGRVLRDYGDAG